MSVGSWPPSAEAYRDVYCINLAGFCQGFLWRIFWAPFPQNEERRRRRQESGGSHINAKTKKNCSEQFFQKPDPEDSAELPPHAFCDSWCWGHSLQGLGPRLHMASCQGVETHIKRQVPELLPFESRKAK